MKPFIITLSALYLLLFPSALAFAQIPNPNADAHAFTIPERNGDYPDPEHPGVRVRVFVHQTRNPVTVEAVCTDPDSTANDGVTGWHLPSAVTYNLNTSSVPSSVSASFPTVADNAYDIWQTAVNNKVNFSRGADTTANRQSLDFRNIVAFGRTSGTALAVTYTRYYTATHQVADVDTIFNRKFAWSWTPYSAGACGDPASYDVQNILTHELGHWMGLDDQTGASFVDNTMYGYGSRGEIKKDTLTAGDTAPLTSIYP